MQLNNKSLLRHKKHISYQRFTHVFSLTQFSVLFTRCKLLFQKRRYGRVLARGNQLSSRNTKDKQIQRVLIKYLLTSIKQEMKMNDAFKWHSIFRSFSQQRFKVRTWKLLKMFPSNMKCDTSNFLFVIIPLKLFSWEESTFSL